MKNVFKIVALSGLAFMLASCGTANDAYGNNYPNNYPTNYPTNNGGVYRVPDGTVYRQGDVYRDRNGNVYQNGRIIRTGDVMGRPGILGRNANANNNRVYYPKNKTNARRLPPGQAKKIYGNKAKDYAPGQVKKRNGNWNGNQNMRNDDQRKYKSDNNRKFENKKGNESKKQFKTRNGKRNGDD